MNGGYGPGKHAQGGGCIPVSGHEVPAGVGLKLCKGWVTTTTVSTSTLLSAFLGAAWQSRGSESTVRDSVLALPSLGNDTTTRHRAQQRGWEYEWVVFARAEMVWVHDHPPIEVLSPKYVYIPMGQDNSFYNFNDLKGINDRHAAVPKRWFKSYFNRWECLLNGNAWKYLAKVAKAGYMINTEQYLWLHLQAEGVQVRRFAPVSFLSHCTEGPQCQHLYKGTDLGKVRWTQTAKYWTEMLESRRTIVDDFHYVKRPEKGWIWLRQWPPVPLIWGAISKKQFENPLEDVEPQEKVGADLACGLSKHGPISSLRWVFFLRCECHA
eukprot:s7816_g1.t1